MIKVCLTHDVDRIYKTYQVVTHSLKSLKRGEIYNAACHLGSLLKFHKVYWNFNDIMRIENEFGVKSTFFFLNESLPFQWFKPETWKLSLGRYKITNKKVVRLIKELAQKGWEIGVHGSYNSYKNPKLLIQEKIQIEKIVNKPVIGIRQHYLNMEQNTWKYQRDAGFLYDSSLGFTNDIGFKDNQVTPLRPFNDHFAVIPMVVMDSGFMEHQEPWQKLAELTEICESENAYMVINWHSNNFHPKEFPGYMDSYIQVIDFFKKREARFMTLREAYEDYLS